MKHLNSILLVMLTITNWGCNHKNQPDAEIVPIPLSQLEVKGELSLENMICMCQLGKRAALLFLNYPIMIMMDINATKWDGLKFSAGSK